MKISSLQDCSVFIDTNILIYAFTSTRFTPVCEELLEKVRNGVVKGHINSTVIDEFFTKSCSCRYIPIKACSRKKR